MTFSEASFIEEILTLVLIMGFVGIFLSFVFLRGKKRECRNDLRFAGATLRNMEYRLRVIKNDVIAFTKDDPEPYGEIAQDLAEQEVHAEIILRDLRNLYSVHQSTFTQLYNLPFHLQLFRIFDWTRFKVNLDSFHNSFEPFDRQYEKIEDFRDLLQNVSAEISTQSRQLLASIQQAIQVLGEIESLGLEDNAFKETELAIKEWETTLLHQIPVSFLGEPSINLADQPEKLVVSRVYRLIHNSRQDISIIVERVLGWKHLHQRITNQKKTLVQREKAINQIITSLENHNRLPVKWDVSGKNSIKLKDDLNLTINQIVTVSGLEKLNEVLIPLERRQIQLEKEIEHILEIHRELGKIESEFDCGKAITWAKNALATIESVTPLNLSNWKSISDIPKLSGDLQNFIHQINLVLERKHSVEIAESAIATTLKTLIIVRSNYEQFLPVYDEFLMRYKDIQVKVKNCKDILARDFASLNQARGIINSNPFLSKIAGQELEKIIVSIEKLNAELDHPELGLIDDKSNRADQLHKKTLEVCQKWLQKLSADVSLRKEELSETVNVLQDLVSLSDPVFAEVITLLQEQRQNGIQPALEKNEVLGLTRNIKDQSEIWQRVVASQKAITDIAGPVLDRFRKMEKNRLSLQEQISRADKIIPETLAWPPHTQRLTIERSKYQALENNYLSFKKERHKAIQLMGLISDLSDGYQELNSTVVQIVDRAQQEQNRFLELERRYNVSKQMWSRLAKNDKSTAVSIEEINKLLTMVEKDFQELQRRYRSGGLPYQQAYQIFRMICRKLDEATVELGGGQLMDINGVVQKKI